MKYSIQETIRQARITHPVTQFAGFTFPRAVARPLAIGLQAIKKRRAEHYRSPCGHSYRPEAAPADRNNHIFAFYDEARASFYRDDIAASSINSRLPLGYYVDEWQDETISARVFCISHGRYVAGWSLGTGCIAAADRSEIYTDIHEAARAADRLADREAERWREDAERCERQRQAEEAAAEEAAAEEAERQRAAEEAHARAMDFKTYMHGTYIFTVKLKSGDTWQGPAESLDRAAVYALKEYRAPACAVASVSIDRIIN